MTDTAPATAPAEADAPAAAAPEVEAEGTPPPAEAAPPPGPSREEIQREKLEELRARRREREARAKVAEERAAELDKREAAVKGWASDPRSLLTATGADPQEVLRTLVAEAERDGTPEGMVAKLRSHLEAELQKRDALIAELKAEREREQQARAQAEQQARAQEVERRFLDVALGGDAYAPVRAFYTQQELVQLGHFYAEALTQSGALRGVADPLARVAEEILKDHQTRIGRLQSTGAVAHPANVPAGKPVNGGRPNTLSNRGTEGAAKPKFASFEEKVEFAKKRFG